MKGKMPEVSVIIPFHNRIEWTKEAIQSVLRQTYQDFEIILVDDGSDINYQAELEKLDARIIYLRQTKLGPSCARNTGLAHAQGQFLAFLDSDDLFLENKLATQIRMMQANPEVLLSHTSFSLMDIDGKEYAQISTAQFTGQVYPAILANCPIATPTVVLRKEALQFAKFEENIHLAEDLLFWSKIAKNSKILGIPEFLSRVRNHGRNALFDYDKQMNGLMNLIQYGIQADPEIKPYPRMRLYAEIYWQFGFIYRKKRQYLKGAFYSILALVLNPLLLWPKIKQILGKLLPASWKRR